MTRLRLFLFRGKLANYQVQLNDGRFQIGILKYRDVPNVLPDGEKAISLALSELGTPYRFGEANGPEDPGTDGFDCSGLTQWAWAGAAGISLPHSARLQKSAPNVFNFTIKDWLKPGDLVFFWFPNSRGIPFPSPSHVGLWLKPDRVVDTRSQSSPVAIRPIEDGSVVGYGRPQ
jgi:cell wall-associated NlpC family hydrolase